MSDSFKARIIKLESAVWSHSIHIPEEIASKYMEGEKRLLCQINGLYTIHAALMSAGNGLYFVNINKELRKKLGVTEGDYVTLKIEKDNSKYGIPCPEEMSELLKIDDETDMYFHALTRGKQRSLLYIIGKPKNSDTRLRKAIIITEYLKNTKGKLDFKELNEAFKNSDY